MSNRPKWTTLIISIIVIGVGYKALTSKRFGRWLTTPATVFEEVAPKTYRQVDHVAFPQAMVPTNTIAPEPREGSVEITTTPDDQWITAPSKSCFESNKWLSGTIVTPGIFWQVMLDNDTNKVRSLYPKDWKTNSVRLETNTFNVHSWRVDPRHHPQGTKAVVRWRITDQPPN